MKFITFFYKQEISHKVLLEERASWKSKNKPHNINTDINGVKDVVCLVCLKKVMHFCLHLTNFTNMQLIIMHSAKMNICIITIANHNLIWLSHSHCSFNFCEWLSVFLNIHILRRTYAAAVPRSRLS